MAKRLMIEGLVQGVGYRYAFAERATALGLAGWVRNRSNGAVEASIHGPADAEQAIIDWSHRGPGAARVSRVLVQEETEPAPSAATFDIRPTA
ncbi:acylphosphatase [Pseudoduganella violaceinigra]|uniref:acylphosphatase n=1 Tax=Pseudoduganella violaceinigra TaxID=246602 RepID=UPI00040614E6|nr:acylphosphatase [Pseudoduganella violaceinigra]